MALSNPENNKLIRKLHDDLRQLKKLRELTTKVEGSNRKRALSLSDYVEGEARRIADVKKKLNARREKANAIVVEREKKLATVKNSSLSKKMQEQKERLESIQKLNKEEKEKRQKLLQEIKRNKETRQSNSNAEKEREREDNELALCIKATQFEFITPSEDFVDLQFKCIDKNDPDKLYVCRLALGKSDVSVQSCTTRTPDLHKIVERYNEDGDFVLLLKAIRKSFKESANNPTSPF